ncbi:DUF3531 family protein [Acaryochloris sp. CCMEE 5410]|uniref:DUF3531 family protein n=1 Tax=Acaryochloris sp. CCMEE 5410 TaxID=310037 RepID=UPI0002484047|nr:DUF3531 family protein [Acaryochloris sp. CCMEE 5410]KAI9130803.1 DUF3531 family protein [Acaryochloris sp. CCMEE 5410]
MNIQFREFNSFDLWLWLEFETVLSEQEKQYLEEVFDSWFFLGKLGGFNAENLQVQDAGYELSYLQYELEAKDGNLMALMHNMGEIEYEGCWARCWFDLGTSDAIALDVLLNALQQFNTEFIEIKQLLIGGENEDWPLPEHRDRFYQEP